MAQFGEGAAENDTTLIALNKELERQRQNLIGNKNELDNTTGALNELKDGTNSAVEAEKKRIESINEIISASAEEAAAIGKTAREQAIAKAMTESANETQIAAINHIYDLIEARTEEEKAIKEAEKAEKKRQETVDGMIKTAATQASTIGMTKRELDVYKATLQGASAQEIASLNALHDIIDARKSLTKELKAQEDAQKELKNEEIDAFTNGMNTVLDLIEDPTLAARTQAQERINIADEMVTRGIISEQQYAEAVLKIHEELHNKLGVIKGTSGQGSDRTIVDIGTDFDALLESQKTEMDLFREHQQAKLDLITEHENAVNDVMIDYGELRKQINDETNAYMEAGNLAAMSAVIGSAQQQVNTLSGFFDQASGIGKAFYLVSQAMAAGNAVIQGYLTSAAIKTAYAGMAATAGPGAPAILAAGEAHAAAAIGMGFATAAAIAGQTVASFEGGGMTFNGVRSGGMDGRGGRLAMVHPNEKITDMEKGNHSDQPVNVNINIQAVDAKGIDELLIKRRGVITSLVRNSLNNTGARLG
jgi:peptidoglycan hydrolase CwlO-like protein